MMILGTGFITHSPNDQLQPVPTFNNSIGPIFFNKCTPCHQNGQGGAFPLSNYKEIVRHERLIKFQAISKNMPPCAIDSDFGTIPITPSLTDKEVLKIQLWLNNKTPLGVGEEVKFNQTSPGWKLMNADKVIKTSPETNPIPAEGVQTWFIHSLPEQEEEFSFTAFDITPYSAKAMRHAVLAMVPNSAQPQPGAIIETAGDFINKNTQVIGVWAPGYRYWAGPDNKPIHVPKGFKLIVLASYQPSGKKEDSGFDLNLKTTPQSKENLKLETVDFGQFVLAADESPIHTISYQVKEDSELVSVLPVARFFALRMDVNLIYPDKSSKVYMSTKRWDPYWIGNYSTPEPASVPAGTTIQCKVWFSNDENCTMNEDNPPQPVFSGPKIENEVFKLHLVLAPK